VFLGIVKFTFVGKEVSFPDPQWGPAIWAIILAAIWFWVAAGFWNLRASAWSFGNIIALFTLIFGFFAVLGSSTLEAEFGPMLVAFIVIFYLNSPGVRDRFIEHEMSLLTPAQKAALEQMQAAQLAMAQATAASGGVAAAPSAPAAASAPAAPAAAPPSTTPDDPTG
jgi:hypothetical protein